jgi:hypothetical protein
MTKHPLRVATLVCLVLVATALAQTPTTPTPPPIVRPANGPALLGDDFESGEIKWPQIVTAPATIKIVQDRVAHGKNAVVMHYPAGTRGVWAFIAAPLPDSLHDELWGRAYVYISSLPPAHSVLMLAGSHGFPIADFLEIGTQNGLFQPSFQLNAPTPERKRGETVGHEGNVPLAKWFCLEWRFTDKPDRIVMWIDGMQVADKSFTMNGASSELVRGFLEYDFGFRSWAQAAAIGTDIDVYYDDVAIGNKPIGQLAPVVVK